MNGLEYIQNKQVAWAMRKGLTPVGSTFQNEGEKNYVEKLEENLFHALTDETLKQLERGDGHETKGITRKGKHYRPKINALHSSAAIVINLFQYWHNKDVLPILYACGLCSKQPPGIDMMYENIGADHPSMFSTSRNPLANKIEFERKYKITGKYIPPNIDIVIGNFQPQIYAIESKFTEPYRGKPSGISKEHIDKNSLWIGLPNLHELAKEISPDNHKFEYLDAAQLIRHILGLKNEYKNGFKLLYLWYDVIGHSGSEHRNEIEQFAKIAKKDKIKFSHITYQEVISRLTQEFYAGNEDYCNYLTDRYL